MSGIVVDEAGIPYSGRFVVDCHSVRSSIEKLVPTARRDGVCSTYCLWPSVQPFLILLCLRYTGCVALELSGCVELCAAVDANDLGTT